MKLSIPDNFNDDKSDQHVSNQNESKNSFNQLEPIILCDQMNDTLEENIRIVSRSQICEICGRNIESRESHDNEHMIMILEHLYLGGKRNAHNMIELINFKINVIVNVASEIENKFYDSFEYMKVPWNDTPGFLILGDLDMIVDQILLAVSLGKNVLVHCRMGISRSVAVIIGYLMKYWNKKYNDAYDFVKSKKSLICPNEGFVLQLNTYYDKKLNLMYI